MAGVNKVILIGNLGRDPEVRSLDNGAKVANFSMATSESWKDKNTGEKKEVTEWHKIVAWRGLAELAEKYLHKGDKIYVEGKLKTRKWQDKEDNTRYTTEVVIDNMTMLGGKPKSENNSGGATTFADAKPKEQPAQNPTAVSDDDDDLAF